MINPETRLHSDEMRGTNEENGRRKKSKGNTIRNVGEVMSGELVPGEVLSCCNPPLRDCQYRE